MYQHTGLHITATVSLSVALLVLVIASIFHLYRGEITFVRRTFLVLVGIAMLLAGNLMRGGPHDRTADVLGLLGSFLMILNALWWWHKVGKPAV